MKYVQPIRVGCFVLQYKTQWPIYRGGKICATQNLAPCLFILCKHDVRCEIKCLDLSIVENKN